MPDRAGGFVQRTAIVVAEGCLAQLPEQLARMRVARPALLIDQGLVDAPVGAHIHNLMTPTVTVTIAGGEPHLESVLEVADKLGDAAVDGVVAVGGGSTLDTAKLARGLRASGARTFTELPDTIPGVVPLVALPTTAGTGAEIGAGAIVYDPAVGDKVLIRRAELAAAAALCDSDTTLTLPAHLTAFTGCDALAQAILAYVPSGEDSVSGQTALQAIKLIFRNLPRAVADGADRGARRNQMLGSVMSAMAMYNAPPDYAGEHVFAEPVGAALGVHHGHAVAAFLSPTAEFNSEVLAGPYAQIATEIGLDGADDRELAANLAGALKDFVRRLGVRPLGDIVTDYDVADLVRRCKRHEAFALNPRPIADDDARAILTSAFTG